MRQAKRPICGVESTKQILPPQASVFQWRPRSLVSTTPHIRHQGGRKRLES